ASCLARQGDHAGATAEAEAILHGPQVSAQLHFSAACTFALASAAAHGDAALAGRYADRAVALLRQCQAAGFLTNPRGIAALASDGNLERLGSRADSKEVRRQVEAAAKAPYPSPPAAEKNRRPRRRGWRRFRV